MMLERQLKALPDGLGQRLLDDLADKMKKTTVRNPTAYLLANLKRAREGRFNLGNSATDKPLEQIQPKPPETVLVAEKRVIKRARREYVSGVMAELREAYFR